MTDDLIPSLNLFIPRSFLAIKQTLPQLEETVFEFFFLFAENGNQIREKCYEKSAYWKGEKKLMFIVQYIFNGNDTCINLGLLIGISSGLNSSSIGSAGACCPFFF